jgi:hypothetical protein
MVLVDPYERLLRPHTNASHVSYMEAPVTKLCTLDMNLTLYEEGDSNGRYTRR